MKLSALVIMVMIATATATVSASPPAKLLAYQSEIGGDWEIYVTRVGERPRQLTHNPVADRLPEWSPDGRRILFFRGGPRGVGGFYVMNADGTDKRRLGKVRPTTPPWSVSPDVRSTSPDGRWTVYGDYPGIYIRSTDGRGEPRKITELYSPDPNWSTDGKWISFWTRELPGGKTTSDYSHFNLWAVSPDGKNQILVARKAVRETWQP